MPDEAQLRESISNQLHSLLTALDELRRLFLSAQRDAETYLDIPQRNWFLSFFSNDGIPQLDDWKMKTTRLINDPQLLFSSQAISWIGEIKAISKVFDADFSSLLPSAQISNTFERIASDARAIYKNIYMYRNPTTHV